jgi:hypothetical protein
VVATGTAAPFVRADIITQGGWSGVYGCGGYALLLSQLARLEHQSKPRETIGQRYHPVAD